MPLRLSELLERIRPAGSPGAPSDAEPRRDAGRLDETAELTQLLRVYEAEADALIADAHATARTIRASAELEAQRIRAALPDRVATVEAEVIARQRRSDDENAARLAAEAEARIVELESHADVDEMSGRIVDAVWSSALGEVAP